MINLLPTPKYYEIRNSVPHKIAKHLHAEKDQWKDAVEAFCESFLKIFEMSISVGEKGGIELVYDAFVRKDAYILESADALVIRASDCEGLNYALASALQLLSLNDGELFVQDLVIEDYPEKNFRAFMIDIGYCWHPFDKLLKYVDLCFLYKINHLHMHISDSAIYSLPSKAFPKLPTENKHYTYEQIVELNRYAAARGVLLVPEFECPGHAVSLNRAYPEVFANHADGEMGEFRNELGEKIDTKALVCAGSQVAFEGVKTLLAEIVELFPNAPYIHIGGDEAPYEWWEHCKECRSYMKAHGIADAHELYSEYIGRVTSYVLSLGKTPMVWEGFPKESAHYVPKETVVIAWESHYQMSYELLANGFKIINASWQPTYLVNSLVSRWGPKDLLNWNVYNWQHWWPKSEARLNPIHIAPTDDVLGATMCSWSLTYEQHIGRLLENFPAFAERTWTVKRLLDDDSYMKVYDNILSKGAWLVQDR